MVSIRPIDWVTILESVKKTKRLCVVDTGHMTCSVASEVVARVACEMGTSLKSNPVRWHYRKYQNPHRMN